MAKTTRRELLVGVIVAPVAAATGASLSGSAPAEVSGLAYTRSPLPAARGPIEAYFVEFAEECGRSFATVKAERVARLTTW
jgi:hypothetical protein